ncbi:MAG: hypothetical protein GY733_21775 [bacterium]|nr:hypothetical protein [bacterium]
MERGSLDKLKHDNRLRMRKGWIDETDDEAHLASLPDAGDKVHVPEEEKEAPAAPAVETAASPVAVEQPASQSLDPLSPPFREVSE